MVKRDMTRDPRMQQIWAGRSIEEQAEYIKAEGTHALASVLRYSILRNVGLSKPKPTAETVIMTGCYTPYTNPSALHSMVKLFDRLNVDYTHLEKEYCCGLPLVEMVEGEEREQATRLCKEFIGMNIALARERGAKHMVYNCIWCVHIARQLFPDEPIKQLYRLDVPLERLRGASLQVKPATAGYFEGCRVRTRAYAPDVKLDWPGYRQQLGGIKGLEVIDLPKLCCVYNGPRIVEEVEKRKLRTVISPCGACINRLKILLGKVEVKSPQDILLEALG
ncbi:MAG: (Fe-S)-binding protein [Dehalococcoidales bacterium]|nr:(Fe-S)-binding protein [Dehalococcoidales bacterium]